jgi:anti-anti-sigma factor
VPWLLEMTRLEFQGETPAVGWPARGEAMENVDVGYCGTDIAIVKLYGEHDLGDAKELRKLLEQQLGAHDLLIADLSEVDFIDCSVLNTLVSVKTIADRNGLGLTLQLGVDTNARRVLEISRLDGFFACASSREEAIALTRQPASGRDTSGARPPEGRLGGMTDTRTTAEEAERSAEQAQIRAEEERRRLAELLTERVRDARPPDLAAGG